MTAQMQSIKITTPDDFHLHVRDGELMRLVVPHTARRFARAIIMPNLVPPIVSTELARQYRGAFSQRFLVTPASSL